MKTLRESLFDQDINTDDVEEAMIRKWLEDNYVIRDIHHDNHGSNYTLQSEYKQVIFDYNIIVRNEKRSTLTRLLPDGWKFGPIEDSIYLENCTSLKSLEGLPSECKDIYCQRCESLKTLEGLPQTIRGYMYLEGCTGLKSFKGSPKYVSTIYCVGSGIETLEYMPKVDYISLRACKNLRSLKGAGSSSGAKFDLKYCTSLKSLEGLPRMVEDLDLSGCTSLKSLEGLPSIIKGDLTLNGCPIEDETPLQKCKAKNIIIRQRYYELQ